LKHLFFLILCLGICYNTFGQATSDVKLKAVPVDKPMLEFFTELEQQYDIRFFYQYAWFNDLNIHINISGMKLDDALRALLKDTGIEFIYLYKYAFIFIKDPTNDLEKDRLIQSARERNAKVEDIVFGDRNTFIPGKQILLKGRVIENRNGTPLADAEIYVNGGTYRSVTKTNGEFQFNLPQGRYVLTIHHANHEEKLLQVALFETGSLDIPMDEVSVQLQEVEVTDQLITNARISQSTIKLQELKRTPSFLGIPDIVRQIQTQPGVTTVSEASSGFNVRGGNADQNLVLFDGVPIFNTSHALGFFTAFNTEALSQVSFYKGGIPAEFGGRSSSVLNLMAKEGDYQKWRGSGGIGVLFTDIVAGGPIKKDTSSLLVSFRSSYSDWLLNVLKTRFHDVQNGSVFFYDGTIKYSHRVDSRSKVTASVYQSSDRFSLATDTTNRWQNIAVALRYDHTLNQGLVYSAGLYFGHYGFRMDEVDPRTAFTLKYSITYPSLKIDFNREGALHKQSYGFHTTYYSFSPGKLRPGTAVSNVLTKTMPTEKSIESAIYFSDSFYWTDKLFIDMGLRMSLYTRVGTSLVYQYKNGEPREVNSIVDSTTYGPASFVKSYLGPEPRLSVRYTLGHDASLKLGFNRMYQYVHLISNTASITPIDIWQSSNTYFKPQMADQISIGYYNNSKSNVFETSVEGYYKSMQNILDYKDGASLILNRQLETAILSGVAKAYGAELAINKLKGRLLGGLNYTYSRTLRKVNGNFAQEKINRGLWYPANYDQPHIVNLNWRYVLTKRIFFTGFFTYHTGRPVSLPIAGFNIDNVPVTVFSERNNYRIPAYHRLDMALVIEGSPRKKKAWEGSWVISFYNVYGRKNPYSVFFVDTGGGVLRPYKLSLIGTVVPSLTYRFKF
jgi:hypothetical protein